MLDRISSIGVPVVVDDGSTDATADIVNSRSAILISHKKNMGYDAALNSGILFASTKGFNCFITYDADGQHNPDALMLIADRLNQGAQVVIGVRNKFPRVAEYFFSWVAQLKWGLQDPLCGLKGYQFTVYKGLGYFDSYCSIGTELALYAVSKEMKVEQVIINIKERDGIPRFGIGLIPNLKILRALILGFVKY